tara:strand:+ start:684 stop:1007 length:324 start_codon:yes stop_codon:yes gene_type:complete
MEEEKLPPSPSPKNEGEYIEMANHLKQLYDEIGKKNEKLKQDKHELQKVLLGAYGMVRCLDNLVDNIYDVPSDLVVLIETLRSSLSDELDTHIFNIKKITIADLTMI